MVNIKSIAISITFAILLVSCQSAVRFTSSPNELHKSITKSKTKSTSTSTLKSSDHINVEDNEIIKVAESWLGVPYIYGGDSRGGIDCSAFVQSVYRTFGVNLPRTSQDQYDYLKTVDENDREVGDLVFFRNKGKISHVGIYVGDNVMIHASTSKGVIRQDLNEYTFRERYAGTGRVNKP